MLKPIPARHVHNARASLTAAYAAEQRRIINTSSFKDAWHEISSWPGYAPTPLLVLPGLARALAVDTIAYKDEGKRFGLGSFKALGGAYAVLRLLQQHLRSKHGIGGASAAELRDGRYRSLVSSVTVTCATDGNHGRSVAWGAQMFGCRCVIYLHAHVSAQREAAITSYGAEIVRVPGTYDHSVRLCEQDAQRNGWLLVADTSADGDANVQGTTATVMQGYGVLIREAMEQMGGAVPTHLFVQAGVGGLAAAVAGYLWERLGPNRPRIVVVEPARADCVFRSIAASTPTPVPGSIDTFMACLAAGEISRAAWPILKTAVDDVLALRDEAAEETMRVLANGVAHDAPVVAGESGCAAVAGLIAAALDERLRAELSLDRSSRVLAIGSEGATDPETYERVVGRSPAAVQAAASLTSRPSAPHQVR